MLDYTMLDYTMNVATNIDDRYLGVGQKLILILIVAIIIYLFTYTRVEKEKMVSSNTYISNCNFINDKGSCSDIDISGKEKSVIILEKT